MPFFSVITPSWNQGQYIGNCIESVLSQSDRDFEHLIFDNCSTDDTASVVARYPHVEFVSERDRGQSDAVNRGFLKAKGEVVCWLNSDDAYAAGAFERIRERFADPDVDVIFGHVRQVSYCGGSDQLAEARFDRREDLVRWWSSRARIHQPAVFFRRSVRERIGLLREDLHLTMDYEYWWRMSEHYRFHLVSEVLAIQHRQPESKTVRDWSGVYRERERVFSHFYGLIDEGDRDRLMVEKRRAMAGKYLDEAYALSGRDTVLALRLLMRSFREWPASVLEMRWPGVLRRIAMGEGPGGT